MKLRELINASLSPTLHSDPIFYHPYSFMSLSQETHDHYYTTKLGWDLNVSESEQLIPTLVFYLFLVSLVAILMYFQYEALEPNEKGLVNIALLLLAAYFIYHYRRLSGKENQDDANNELEYPDFPPVYGPRINHNPPIFLEIPNRREFEVAR